MQNTIAVIFDFDETLAPDSTSSFLESIGVDVPQFWQKRVAPLLESGWDPVTAYLYQIIEESNSRAPGQRITRNAFENWGSGISLYSGAMQIFDELRAHAESVSSEVEIQYYMISSGIRDIVNSTKIAKQFTDIWACDFHYNQQDEIEFPKNIVSFTDKTRYLFHISKGIIGEASRSRPFDVNRKIPDGKLRIPTQQMIFVGDGHTDVPCFSLVKKLGGVAIGVYDRENQDKWGRAWGFIEDDRVSHLVAADYTDKSGLNDSLKLAIYKIAANIKLRMSTYQG